MATSTKKRRDINTFTGSIKDIQEEMTDFPGMRVNLRRGNRLIFLFKNMMSQEILLMTVFAVGIISCPDLRESLLENYSTWRKKVLNRDLFSWRCCIPCFHQLFVWNLQDMIFDQRWLAQPSFERIEGRRPNHHEEDEYETCTCSLWPVLEFLQKQTALWLFDTSLLFCCICFLCFMKK